MFNFSEEKLEPNIKDHDNYIDNHKSKLDH